MEDFHEESQNINLNCYESSESEILSFNKNHKFLSDKMNLKNVSNIL